MNIGIIRYYNETLREDNQGGSKGDAMSNTFSAINEQSKSKQFLFFAATALMTGIFPPTQYWK